MFIMMVIEEILDKDNKPKIDDKSNHRRGQRVQLNREQIRVGERLPLSYVDRDGMILLSETQDVEENEYGFRIETENTIYIISYIS